MLLSNIMSSRTSGIHNPMLFQTRVHQRPNSEEEFIVALCREERGAASILETNLTCMVVSNMFPIGSRQSDTRIQIEYRKHTESNSSD